jgi:hypothetical protein
MPGGTGAGDPKNKKLHSSRDEYPMSTNDPEFYQTPKFSPEQYEAPPRQRGCFFYGCIIASVLALVMLVFVAILLFVAYRWANRMVEEYTSTAPIPLPTVEMPAEQRQAVKDRVENFRKAVESGTASDPLVLSSDDLNALIEDNPELKGKLYVTVDGDELKGKVSFPIGEFIPMLKGRYLNGEADLKASLRDGVLIVTLEEIEVNGKKAEGEFLKALRQQNLAKDAYKDEKSAEMLRKLESLEIKDGKIVLKVRPKAAGASTPAGKGLIPVEVVPPANTQLRTTPPKNSEPPAKAAPEPAPAKAAAPKP